MPNNPTQVEPVEGLVERLDRLIDARRDFVAKRTAMKEAIHSRRPATPAERALYDERYKADHEAEWVLFREALQFAEWAADANPLALSQATEREAKLVAENERLTTLAAKLQMEFSDYVERSKAEIARKNKALQPFADKAKLHDGTDKHGFITMPCQPFRDARQALGDSDAE